MSKKQKSSQDIGRDILAYSLIMLFFINIVPGLSLFLPGNYHPEFFFYVNLFFIVLALRAIYLMTTRASDKSIIPYIHRNNDSKIYNKFRARTSKELRDEAKAKARARTRRRHLNSRYNSPLKKAYSGFWLGMFFFTILILLSSMTIIPTFFKYASPQTALNYFFATNIPLGIMLVVALYKSVNLPEENQLNPDEFFYEENFYNGILHRLKRNIIYYTKSPCRIIRNKTRKSESKLTRLSDDYALSSDGELIEIDDNDELESST
jgi:hypothetical protein